MLYLKSSSSSNLSSLFITQPNALIVADRIRKAAEDIRFCHQNQNIRLTVSIGVAGWIPKINEAPEKIILAADKALYDAKKRGRNQSRAAVPTVD